MPRGNERTLTYVRERDAQGRLVIRAVPAPERGEEAQGVPPSRLEPAGRP